MAFLTHCNTCGNHEDNTGGTNTVTIYWDNKLRNELLILTMKVKKTLQYLFKEAVFKLPPPCESGRKLAWTPTQLEK